MHCPFCESLSNDGGHSFLCYTRKVNGEMIQSSACAILSDKITELKEVRRLVIQVAKLSDQCMETMKLKTTKVTK